MVKGSGVVESVDTSSSTGIAVIKLDSYQGPIVVKLQIGPRISGDSVRDSVGFIEFGMFKEQTEYGKVSREINKRIADTVVKDLNLEQLPSKSVTFYGAFTIRTTNQTNLQVKEVVIVPVKIEVK
jgi:predicted lipoprotein